jgi:hypothetical protein
MALRGEGDPATTVWMAKMPEGSAQAIIALPHHRSAVGRPPNMSVP